MDQCSHIISVQGKPFTLDLHDSLGNAEYGDRLRPLIYVGCDLFIVTFSSVDKTSYEMVKCVQLARCGKAHPSCNENEKTIRKCTIL